MFRFKRFSVLNDRAALKVDTDAVLLGASMTLLSSDRRLLDIGTGTGVIALMAAQRLSDLSADFSIDAIDIDGPSVEEAGLNFAASPWSARLAADLCRMQSYVPEGKYDLIFSNPPFFEHQLRNPDPHKASARHDVSLSPSDILAFASEHLSPSGRLSLVLPSESELLLTRTAASFGLHPFRTVRISTTAAKAPRRIVIELSRSRGEVTNQALVLQEGSARTKEYDALTEQFYL